MSEHDVTDLLESGMPVESLEILRAIGRIADERGVGAFVVGGVVRDLLLGTGNCDLDVVVDDDAPSFAEHAARSLGGSVKAHTRFGTAILVLTGGRKVDLATARREAYERPGALPTVESGSIADDLRRRDFTINAMAVRLNAAGFGTLIDEFGGEADLREGVLRVLTDRSFDDDPTRVLRGVRFAARFGYRFEDGTRALLREALAGGALSTVSGERIMNEITLILSENDPWPPVERMIDWGILPAIEGGWILDRSFGASFRAVASLLVPGGPGARVEPWLMYLLAMLEPLTAEARERVLDRLTAGRKVREKARHVERLEAEAAPALETEGEMSPSRVYHALAGLSVEVVLLAAATHASPRVRERALFFLSDLRGVGTSLDGCDLKSLGVPEGPRVGEILAKLLDARLDGAVTTEAEERALARRLSRELDAGHKSC